MHNFEVEVIVKKVEGYCAAGYEPGTSFIVRGFYIPENQTERICLHALGSMLTLLMPFLKGISARDLGIGLTDDVGYIRCPDPGAPYTCGGSVLFELKRIKIRDSESE